MPLLGGPLIAPACLCLSDRYGAVDEEEINGGAAGCGGGRGRRGGGGQHVPHRRRRGCRARRHGFPHPLLAQGHLPGVRRRGVHPQVRGDAAGQRRQEGRGPDRLPQLQRPRQARTDRQVDPCMLPAQSVCVW